MHSPRSPLQAPLPPAYGAFPTGTSVTLKGLNSAELNGERGTVKGWDPVKERAIVELEGQASTMAVKRGNLTQHLRVTVTGTSKPELNGMTGVVVDDVKGGERLMVFLQGERKTLSLKSQNLKFDVGAVVRVTGTSKQAINGLWGKVEKYDQGDGRYDVRVSAGQVLRLKAENVTV